MQKDSCSMKISFPLIIIKWDLSSYKLSTCVRYELTKYKCSCINKKENDYASILFSFSAATPQSILSSQNFSTHPPLPYYYCHNLHLGLGSSDSLDLTCKGAELDSDLNSCILTAGMESHMICGSDQFQAPSPPPPIAQKDSCSMKISFPLIIIKWDLSN